MYFVKCLLNQRSQRGENVVEQLLIPRICINHTEIESRYHLCNIVNVVF